MKIKMKPLVSIVLPTYNRVQVLPYAIRSILKQTYENFELIIVDDNSPDNTTEVVQSFADSRIKYVKNNPNLKLPRALNKGFSISSGEFLTWTSDDNILAENAIEKMVEVLTQENCEFVYADYFEFSELSERSGLPINPVHQKLPDKQKLEKSNQIGACFMYTREVYESVGDYDPELFLVEDYDYFIRIEKAFTCYHIAEPLYYFRRDDNTLYCSRFSEVKSSDILVRYKNQLINSDDALDCVVSLIMSNIQNLQSTILKMAYQLFHKRSYRLTELYKRSLYQYFLKKLARPVFELLKNYESGERDFAASRDALNKMMNNIAKIEYC